MATTFTRVLRYSCSVLCSLLLTLFPVAGQSSSQSICSQPAAERVWIPDNGDGTYTNPVIHADYSDPDVIRVGDEYYLTASSFSHFPGLPILHCNDLVNWRIVGHAVPSYPYPEFAHPQRGMAVWAPAMRYHNGEFRIYFGDPDRGVFMTKAKDPSGPWEPLRLIRKVTGWIDPCPFWDDDGNAYLVHAWANSRVGVKSILAINRMNVDGTEILDDGIVVFVGHQNHPTIEGPKLYKRNGYYYIFAPAGGVKPGWQVVLRSRSVLGPYEDRRVLEQGSTIINGPHQGAWVDTPGGEDWFLHFQDRYAYGRIVHLQPMRWENDWPVVGVDYDGNGIGEPVAKFRKPAVGKHTPIQEPQSNDEFNDVNLGLQWQWEANPQRAWFSLEARKGWLRLFAQQPGDSQTNLWRVPGLLLQKLPAASFSVTAAVSLGARSADAKAGLIIFGTDYGYIALQKCGRQFKISQVVCTNADRESPESVAGSASTPSPEVLLRVEVRPEEPAGIVPTVLCTFRYSVDGKEFHTLGSRLVAREGKWVGAKVGLFCVDSGVRPRDRFVDVDWFRFGRLAPSN